ncbi:unnamed protein product [Thelazia callipaeda]|uniref:Uncharacterized protein n=1 Tax=Thelazia callipaeda TaxID=103827 RepID=A0A0N5D364_THECL|nr:unnamed protein product [Thelazia callipaeda]
MDETIKKSLQEVNSTAASIIPGFPEIISMNNSQNSDLRNQSKSKIRPENGSMDKINAEIDSNDNSTNISANSTTMKPDTVEAVDLHHQINLTVRPIIGNHSANSTKAVIEVANTKSLNLNGQPKSTDFDKTQTSDAIIYNEKNNTEGVIKANPTSSVNLQKELATIISDKVTISDQIDQKESEAVIKNDAKVELESLTRNYLNPLIRGMFQEWKKQLTEKKHAIDLYSAMQRTSGDFWIFFTNAINSLKTFTDILLLPLLAPFQPQTLTNH